MSTAAANLGHMLRALELARGGEGFVEPNPMVGAVIVNEGEVVGEGWHQQFGGPHAEIEALQAAGERARGGTMYVSLEPCCHEGKTPPCTGPIIESGLARVIVAMRDPFPQVAGGGLKQLAAAGIDVELGLGEDEARSLNAPYLKLIETGRPWTIAKWAMTLDGKIATRAGYSQWISSEAARQVVQHLRGRVDAILIGRRTAQLDDPLLTARPAEGTPPRIAARIVLDSQARLASFSQLVRTARQFPTIIAAGPEAEEKELRRLADAGCEVLPFTAPSQYERLLALFDELGRRRMTNVLVEGGSQVLGTLLDARQLDEAHVFIAPRLFGGEKAPTPLGGAGVEQVTEGLHLVGVQVHAIGGDMYVHGRVSRAEAHS
jgi:diaminohydroxyphosphoribosylaminopyrimidine deaminase/5-amino-6-(5-phosphoribosylamino)uracil reductase